MGEVTCCNHSHSLQYLEEEQELNLKKGNFTMKKNLAIFDFDSTIKEHEPKTYTLGGRSKLFPGQQIPEDLLKHKEHLSFSERTVIVNDAFNELKVSREERVDVIENDASVVEGMDQVLKKLHKNHDIIIITGSDYETVRLFMSKHNLLQFVKNIYGRPAHFTNDGKLKLENIPKSWGVPCHSCKAGYGDAKDYKIFCKTSILSTYIEENGATEYDRFIYFGDGHNDLCPALNLGPNAIVCPRKGYKLESLIREDQHLKNVQAKILHWYNGLDILSM